MNNAVQKPIDLLVEDFKNELGDVINSYQQLPLMVMVMVINEIATDANNQYSQYKTRLKVDYEKSLKEAETTKINEQN